MKMLHKIILILLLIPLSIPLGADQANFNNQRSYSDQQIIIRSQLTLQLARHMQEEILSAIDTLYEYLHHWQSHDTTAFKHLHIHTNSHEYTTQTHILWIKHELERLMIFAGTVLQETQMVSRAQNIDTLNSSTEALIQQLIQLAAELNHLNPSDLSFESLASYIKHIKPSIMLTAQPHSKPSHIMRNIHRYGSGLIIGSLATIIAYTHRHLAQRYWNKSKEAVHSFFAAYLKEPLERTWNILFDGEKGKSAFKQNQEAEVEYRTILFNILKDLNDESFSPKSLEDLNLEADRHVKDRTLGPLSNTWIEQNKSFVYYMCLPRGGKIGKIGGAKLSRLELIVSDYALKTDLILQLILMVPSALFVWLTYKGGEKISVHFNGIDHYKAIKTALIKIDKVLNKFHLNEEQLSVKIRGKIAYHLYKLKQSTYTVTPERRKLFLSDLQELTSDQLSIDQKLRTIDRMYRSHAFLQP